MQVVQVGPSQAPSFGNVPSSSPNASVPAFGNSFASTNCCGSGVLSGGGKDQVKFGLTAEEEKALKKEVKKEKKKPGKFLLEHSNTIATNIGTATTNTATATAAINDAKTKIDNVLSAVRSTTMPAPVKGRLIADLTALSGLIETTKTSVAAVTTSIDPIKAKAERNQLLAKKTKKDGGSAKGLGKLVSKKEIKEDKLGGFAMTLLSPFMIIIKLVKILPGGKKLIRNEARKTVED